MSSKAGSATSSGWPGKFPNLLAIFHQILYYLAWDLTAEDFMSQRAAAIKTATKSSTPTTASVPKKSRAAKAEEAERLATEKFWEAYREWQQAADRPAKRRAYIRKVCQRIADEFKPEKIILFGSYAYGKPTPDSDVDLLVVMPFDGGYFQQARKIRRQLNLALPLDLLVRTPEQVRYRLKIGDSFMREILERGKVMYETPHD